MIILGFVWWQCGSDGVALVNPFTVYPKERIMLCYKNLIVLITISVIGLILLGTPASATLLNSAAAQQKDSPKTPSTDIESLAAQVKELQKQLVALQAKVNETPTPRIMAAGTATFERPRMLDNQSGVRVKLSAEVIARLGEDYVVLLTPHLSPGNFPYLIPFWKKTADGFEIIPVDTSLGTGNLASYSNPSNKHLVDWVVVKK
jgi:hypothetical protein